MRISHVTPKLALLAVLATLAGASYADPVPLLQGRTISGQAVATTDPSAVFIYDGYQDITWLRNWNFANTAMDWATAQAWASGLTVGAFDHWVLPDLFQYSALWNVEVPTYADLATHFTNVLHLFYWSSTEVTPGSTNAWAFFTDTGYQTNFDRTLNLQAVAVRHGDVLAVATAVPEPQTLALAMLGLVAGAVAMRRQRAGKP